MNLSLVKNGTRILLLGCTLAASALSGCQTTVGGQTLPSAYYLTDDVQFHPAGPEFQLTNQVRALEQYKLEREGLRSDDGPQP